MKKYLKDELKEVGINILITVLVVWSVAGIINNLLEIGMYNVSITEGLWEIVGYTVNMVTLLFFWWKVIMYFVEKETERLLAEEKNEITAQQKEISAYHEAGHALVSIMVGMDVEEVCILSNNDEYGHTSYWGKDYEMGVVTRKDLMNQLEILLAGREAERYIFSENSSGCIQDLEDATDIAKYMVIVCGMSDNIISFSELDSEEIQEFGPDICNKTTLQIEGLLKEAEEMAKEIIKTNGEFLKKIAQALIEKEIISGEELEEILEED